MFCLINRFLLDGMKGVLDGGLATDLILSDGEFTQSQIRLIRDQGKKAILRAHEALAKYSKRDNNNPSES